MPKINPEDYDDDAVTGYDDIIYDGCDDGYDGSGIFKSDLDTKSELETWEKIRQWGHPYINQTWDQETGMTFECRVWFGMGANTVEYAATSPSIEQGLNDLLDSIREGVFKICDSD